ncbi:MAG: ATP-binding protein [Chloroflexi bacterium]|nr:ATP-binding protein [Chloroflexota bacterium]
MANMAISVRTRVSAVIRSAWLGYLFGSVSVAVTSVLIGLIHAYTSVPNISMLYLVAVLVTAIVFGSRPAVAASLIAFLTFNWFFVAPLHTFLVAQPAEIVALALFLITAIATGELASAQRSRALEARQREREASVMYDVARLLNQDSIDLALRTVAERLLEELNLAAVSIRLRGGKEAAGAADVGDPSAQQMIYSGRRDRMELLRDAGKPTGAGCASHGRWVHIMPPHGSRGKREPADHRLHEVPVRAHEERLGDLFLVQRRGAAEFTEAEDRLLMAVATQLGAAVERIILRHEATESEILRRSDRLKTALLNAVSHDLRTPLASIIASAGSLRKPDANWSEEDKLEFATAIEEEAQRLNRIVGNLLDMSRIQGGSLQPQKAWYDVRALVDDVIGRLRPIISDHHIRVDIPDGLPPVDLDYVEIDQVLSNLIENAARYSPAGEEIEIVARTAGGQIELQVADHGPGIPAEAAAHLFDPFYRVDGHEHVQGAGLGLAVAKGLVEVHGGSIRAENRSGGGASFIFTLPLEQPAYPGGEG